MNRPALDDTCPDWATAVLGGFAQVLMQRTLACGLCCLLAVLAFNPMLLGPALVGALGGLVAAQRRGYPRERRVAGLFCYNGVLIGLLLGQCWPDSALAMPAILAISGLSSLLLARWTLYTEAPLYTAPFVIAGWLTLAVLGQHAPTPTAGAFDPLTATLRGLGQIFLLDSPVSGGLVACGLWLASRRAACWALLGAAAGWAVAWLTGASSEWYASGLAGCNPALAALAFTHRRKAWPLLAIVTCLVLQPVFGLIGLPALTAPFVASAWLVQLGERVLLRSSGLRQGGSAA